MNANLANAEEFNSRNWRNYSEAEHWCSSISAPTVLCVLCCNLIYRNSNLTEADIGIVRSPIVILGSWTSVNINTVRKQQHYFQLEHYLIAFHSHCRPLLINVQLENLQLVLKWK